MSTMDLREDRATLLLSEYIDSFACAFSSVAVLCDGKNEVQFLIGVLARAIKTRA